MTVVTSSPILRVVLLHSTTHEADRVLYASSTEIEVIDVQPVAEPVRDDRGTRHLRC